MATLMPNIHTLDAQDDMEISSQAGRSDIDLDLDFEPGVDELQYHDEEEMQDEPTITYEQEDIEIRSAADDNDYEIDDVMQENPQKDAASPGTAVQVEENVDEELLDLSEDDLETEAGNAQQSLAVLADGSIPPIEIQVDGLTGEYHSEVVQPKYPEPTFDQAGTGSEHSQDAITASNASNVSDSAKEYRLAPGDHEVGDTDVVNKEIIEQGGDSSKQPVVDIQIFEDTGHENDTSTQDANPITTGDEALEVARIDPNDSQIEAAPEAYPDQAPAAIDASPSPHSQTSEDHQTCTGLHPTIVKYGGNNYFLFPSDDLSEGEQYFLGNENLVHGSIGDLLQACRTVLGESISEDIGLELCIDSFDLTISEISTEAFSTSFLELLDLYLQLHRNDGIDHPPAMLITLTARPRFANRLTLIANAAAEGKGMSEIMTTYGVQTQDDYAIGKDVDLDAPEWTDDGEGNTNYEAQLALRDDENEDHAETDQQTAIVHDDASLPAGQQLLGDTQQATHESPAEATSRTVSEPASHVATPTTEVDDLLDEGDPSDENKETVSNEYVDELDVPDPRSNNQLEQTTVSIDARAESDRDHIDPVARVTADAQGHEPVTSTAHEKGNETRTEVQLTKNGLEQDAIALDQHDDGLDEIDFDDDFDELEPEPQMTGQGSVGSSGNSPRPASKRGFEDVLDDEEEQDAKRPRQT